MKADVRSSARQALLMALVATATMVLRLPTPATEGYINLGDVVIVAAALLFGPWAGAVAGGVGSAMADVLGGYAHWAPFTLCIKALEGAIVGWIFRGQLATLRAYLLAGFAGVAGVISMFLGYFAVEWMLYGPGPALASAVGNAVQAASGVFLGVPLAIALWRSGLGRLGKSA
ncbi:MAG: putative membrane protein [Candidatus Latescibacterota bacterium]|jgi:uncharacterized membrane protein